MLRIAGNDVMAPVAPEGQNCSRELFLWPTIPHAPVICSQLGTGIGAGVACYTVSVAYRFFLLIMIGVMCDPYATCVKVVSAARPLAFTETLA